MNTDQKLTPEDALSYLQKQKRFTPIQKPTEYMAGFETGNGRQIALVRNRKDVAVFVEPGDWTAIVPGVGLIKTYEKKDPADKKEGRHANLRANAPRLSAEYRADYLSIPTMAVLSAFCDAYGESNVPLAVQFPTESAQVPQATNNNECEPCMNKILYGPPGTGKTYKTAKLAIEICGGDGNLPREELMARYEEFRKEGRISFVTFHQSYGYEDFIEGLRPELNDGQVSYSVRRGIFREACDAARLSTENYVLIIDEINRANISKVFGELITLLEPDKSEGEINAIMVKLPYSQESFSVPSNLFVIGTMNTADRSIALLDTALRRRFEFEELQPDYVALQSKIVNDINLGEMLRAMNERIEYLYDRDHMIGHAYFINVKTLDDLDVVFRRKVIPLLQEYFYENWAKVQLALNDQVDGFVKVTNDVPKGLESVTEGYGPRPRYRLIDAAFSKAAYQRIYQ